MYLPLVIHQPTHLALAPASSINFLVGRAAASLSSCLAVRLSEVQRLELTTRGHSTRSSAPDGSSSGDKPFSQPANIITVISQAAKR